MSSTVDFIRSQSLTTLRQALFLVDGTPARFSGTPGLKEGDVATIVGHDFRFEFRVLAMRNDSTGTEYPGPVTSFVAWALGCTAFSVFAAFVIGALLAPLKLPGAMATIPTFFGILVLLAMLLAVLTLLLQARACARANQLLRETPRSTPAELEARDALSAEHGPELAVDPSFNVPASIARGFVGVVALLFTVGAILTFAAVLSSMIVGGRDLLSMIMPLAFLLAAVGVGLTLTRFGIAPRLRKRATRS